MAGHTRTDAGVDRAVLWTARNKIVDLGTLGGNSVAFGINDRGQIVGQSRNANDQDRAFVWTARDGMVELETLGGSTSVAFAVNNRSQIVGENEISAATQFHAIMWKP